MIGVRENKITRVPLMVAVAMTRAVADAIAAKDFTKAMSMRDPEFCQSLEGFFATSTLFTEKQLPHHKVSLSHSIKATLIPIFVENACCNYAVCLSMCCFVNCFPTLSSMGAPAGGMNAATRASVRYCIKQGHRPFAVHNGFRGLLDDNIHELSWLGVDSWTSRGGSELGTNRTLPDVDLGAVAARFQEHNFHALLLIGGFEAFNALLILENGRKHYPAFHIPMAHLPATISNNVPLTEFSLGSDTSLNALVDACDSIKQSASASRNRVFVVETQGGKCGYLATMGALAVSYLNLEVDRV
jgi:6-phosphofructokinase 1